MTLLEPHPSQTFLHLSSLKVNTNLKSGRESPYSSVSLTEQSVSTIGWLGKTGVLLLWSLHHLRIAQDLSQILLVTLASVASLNPPPSKGALSRVLAPLVTLTVMGIYSFSEKDRGDYYGGKKEQRTEHEFWNHTTGYVPLSNYLISLGV